MNERDTLYTCGSRYFGLRDDVPAECQGCKRLVGMQRHSRTYWTPPLLCYEAATIPTTREETP